MSPGVRPAVALLLSAMIGACSQESTSPPTLSIVGVWNQGARLRDSVNNQTHIQTGYFSFTQRGEGFTGRGEQSGLCTREDGDYVGPLATGIPYDISDGLQDGDRVSFQTDLCTYEGTLSREDERIEGTARCAYTEGGVDFVWTGGWVANREP